ncbi:DUF4123 domain-containing protein [Pseudomonas sp. AA-38]|uniref:DUF4123 domain-containing protein n=1 Tax=Pseudomonas sp. AA-38 TaxID=3028807 RepID=UPI0023F618D2|nr:DUF4123 domain-containing protein [Pseudomonas sp. AA-38]
MYSWLSWYLEQPATAEPWLEAAGEACYCVIDQVRHPNVLASLYQLPNPVEVSRLFQGTPFGEMHEVSPLWVRVETGSAVATDLAELCRINRSGIILTSSADPVEVLAHARRLLRMHSETYGDSLARYYDPAFWCALALTVPAHELYGPWARVFTPPANPGDPNWRIWGAGEVTGARVGDGAYPIKLEDKTLAAADDLRWWYWLRAHEAETAGRMPNERLPLVLDNLRLLVEHGIDEGRHWERLLPHLGRQSLREHSEYMQVLCSQMPAFEKVQRLEV